MTSAPRRPASVTADVARRTDSSGVAGTRMFARAMRTLLMGPLLRPRLPVADLPSLAQSVHRVVDGQEDRCFERAERTTAGNCERDCRHGHIVWRFPQVIAVVCAEGIPEAVELPTNRLDVRPSSRLPVFRVADQPGPGL